MSQTFSKFKENFYNRIPDPSVFDCEDHNLLKVVLDGLVVDYVKRGIRNEQIFKSGLSADFILFIKRLKHKAAIRSGKMTFSSFAEKLKVPVLLYDNSREARNEQGKNVSFYFYKISELIGKQNCVRIYQNDTNFPDGVRITQLMMATLLEKYSAEDLAFISNLKKSYRNIEKLSVFTVLELQNIRIALNKFFDEYRLWRYILKDSQIKYTLFDQHYHREGMILAMRRRKIKAVELQHGLIAPEDIFYVFPKSIEGVSQRALFPDMIYTYGKYWSDILLKGSEFKPSQVDVLGVYQELNTYVPEKDGDKLLSFLEGNEFVLVTTQTYLHVYFIEFVKWLATDLLKQKSPVKIIVKNHPSEKPSVYKPLEKLKNVLLAPMNTEFLLSRCRWHVSCYSTTLYDAIKYNCENFSLRIEMCDDYVETFVKEGISTRISKNQNPVFFDYSHTKKTNFEKDTLFENYETHKYKLLELVQKNSKQIT